MTANILGFIGLALKGGRIEPGEEPVSAACRARAAKLVLLASDAAENSVRRAEGFAARAGDIPRAVLPCTKAELGAALGRASCAMLAVTDLELAAGLTAKLAAMNEAKYGPCARLLNERAEGERRRRKERQARAREKSKPWAAPPKRPGGPGNK